MEKQAWKKYLTEEQYRELGPDGRMLADYWTTWRPKMCEEMHKAGTLVPTLEETAEELDELHIGLLRQGLMEPEALEFVKEEVFALPPEKEAETAYRVELGLEPETDN